MKRQIYIRRYKKNKKFIDYAFCHGDTEEKLLLVEAKSLGDNLQDDEDQLCSYMGAEGVQWGILTDGNKYIMYNSNASSFEKQKFLTCQIKKDNIKKLAENLIKFIGRDSLENNEVQKFYQKLVDSSNIANALKMLFTKPFDELTKAIRAEFKRENSKTNKTLTINKQQVASYLEDLKDNEDKISLTINSGVPSNDEVKEKQPNKERNVTIPDLFTKRLIKEGDRWCLNYKKKTTYGRITDNGELEVEGELYIAPTQQHKAVTKRKEGITGWRAWKYENRPGEWKKTISDLKKKYLKK